MINARNFVQYKKDLFLQDKDFTAPLHIAFCFDRGFLMPAGVAIFSIIENNKNINLHFHLLVCDVTEKDLLLFTALKRPNISITIYHIINEFNINPDTLILGIPFTTCLRFIIPDVVEQSIPHILYLDCDIICNGSLSEFIYYDFQDSIAGVVSDSSDMQARVDTLGYGVKFNSYFNAGVILINNDEWRKNNITQRALEMINSGKVFRYADQDVLNILLNDKLRYLDGKYNNKTTLSIYHDAEAENLENTIIMHYVTANKPWYRIFEANNFNKYFLHSPWNNVRRYLSPTASEIRLKAKKAWGDKKYSMSLTYFVRYFCTKIFNKRF